MEYFMLKELILIKINTEMKLSNINESKITIFWNIDAIWKYYFLKIFLS